MASDAPVPHRSPIAEGREMAREERANQTAFPSRGLLLYWLIATVLFGLAAVIVHSTWMYVLCLVLVAIAAAAWVLWRSARPRINSQGP